MDQAVGQFAHGDFRLGGDVDFLADGVVRLRQGDEAADGVTDIDEVAGGGGVAELQLGFPIEKLGDDGGDDRAGGLARAEGVERADDGDRQFEGSVERFRKPVCGDLGSAVRRLPLIGMLFIDGNIAGCAVNLGSGSDENLGSAELAGGLQDVEGALDVGIHVGIRRVIAEGDGDQGGEVEDDVDAFHRGFHAVRVADVTAEEVDFRAFLPAEAVQPAKRAEGVVADEGAHLAALGDEVFGEVAADETIGAGDENGFVFQVHEY